MAVITTKNRKRQQIAVEKTGHPAAYRKIRCPMCKQGYGVQSNVEKNKYVCDRCGREFVISSL
jgi:DNA-directed RNA polymerase subunit RPC12/RpoP